MQDNIKFFALGGLDENGKNLFVFEINNNIFIIEAGMKYPDKHTPGVDVIIPDFSYLFENKDRVKAYIISHGHDDQMGALPYIIQKVPAPVYCSKSTEIMIENKINEYGLQNKVKVNYVNVKDGDEITIAGTEFLFISMTHAISESLSVAINTEYGYIFYTSDFIVDFGAPKGHEMDLSRFAKINQKGVFLLLSESGSAEKPGHTSPNHRLTPHISTLLLESEGRTFISLYSQNSFLIKEVIDLAIKYNKKILFFKEKDFDLLNRLEYRDNPIPKDCLIKFEDINRVSPKDLVVIITGAGEHIFNTINELSTGMYNGRNLEFNSSDTFIIACPSVPGTEVISITAIDNIYKTGMNIINLPRKAIASMHAQEEDLKMMLSFLKPRYYLPVKGDYKSLMANAMIALNSSLGFKHTNIFVFDNGMILNIENNMAKINFKETIKVGDLMVEENQVGNVRNEIIQDRQKMAKDGIIILSIAISKLDREIIAGPDVQMRGFIFLKDSENIVKNITQLFVDQVSIYLTGYYENKNEVIEKIKDKILRYVRKETGKIPLILPNILEIN